MIYRKSALKMNYWTHINQLLKQIYRIFNHPVLERFCFWKMNGKQIYR